MRDLVHAFLESSLAEVRRYGGTAPQFTGDTFIALFGAPLTNEDHVRRGFLAAFGIQRALRENSEAADPERSQLAVRIGIHTGPVVFGPITENLPMDYTVIGDMANIAARLEHAAGTILVSEPIHLLARTGPGDRACNEAGLLASASVSTRSEPLLTPAWPRYISLRAGCAKQSKLVNAPCQF